MLHSCKSGRDLHLWYQEILHIEKLEKEELIYDRQATLLGSYSLVLCFMTSEERRQSTDEKRREVNSDEC